VNDVVLDASVAASAVSGRRTEDGLLRERLSGTTCHAPHLLDAEVGSVLRRQVAAGVLRPAVALAGLRALDVLVQERYPHPPLARAAWDLRENLTYYDALYAALAARLGVPLLTADARLARAPGLPCAVELVA
jgi:predicted nucleic acid-binding protein